MTAKSKRSIHGRKPGVGDTLTLVDDAERPIVDVQEVGATQTYLRVTHHSDHATSQWIATTLEADHAHTLGEFLVAGFMSERPSVYLKEIREDVAFALHHLEAWNQRARDDEEHPPYDDITNRLRRIEQSLEQLHRGLRLPGLEGKD